MIQRRVFVSGRVQGVSFRQSTARAASAYAGLRGYIRNLGDGRVEAVFQGTRQEVEQMISYVHHGPAFAEVTRVEVIEEELDPGLGFFHVLK